MDDDRPISVTEQVGPNPVNETPVTAIDDDLSCRRCGYNLRGLTPDHDCPECGASVWRSLQDDGLAHCYPGWLRTLGRGLNLLSVGLVIELISLVVYAFLMATSVHYHVFGYLEQSGALLSLPLLAGAWLLATPEPDRPYPGSRARRAARVLALVAYGLIYPTIFLNDRWPWGHYSVSIVAQLIYLLADIVLLHYVGGLMRRSAWPRLRRYCRVLQYGYLLQASLLIASVPILLLILRNRSSIIYSAYSWFYPSYMGLLMLLTIASLILVLLIRRTVGHARQQAQWFWQNQSRLSEVYRAGKKISRRGTI